MIEGNLGAIRIAVFAGFNKLLGFVQGGGIDQDDACSSGVGSKEIAWRLESLSLSFPEDLFLVYGGGSALLGSL